MTSTNELEEVGSQSCAPAPQDDSDIKLRWMIYAAVGAIVGVLFFVALRRQSAENSSFAMDLSNSMGLGAFSFVAVALVSELMQFEVLRAVLTLLFFGWLYDSMLPREVAASAFATVIVLALVIAFIGYRFRARSFAESRRLAFQVLATLLLGPVLWFCTNVDPCLDHGGVWEWSDNRCSRE
jgi:hypothetical protein